MSIRFDARHVLIDERPSLLLGGEFQYFRIDPALWHVGLSQLKAAGVMAISTYVPWVWHEWRKGVFDFTGASHPCRDLIGFLKVCAALDLSVVIKPGPYIFAEYQGFGLPGWLESHHPEIFMKVRASKPQVFPQPSLNHPVFLSLVRSWFEAVALVITDSVKRGEVIAIQIDNETGYPQFGQGPHLMDHNDATLALLRESLALRHPSIDHLNWEWGTQFTDFDSVVPHDEQLYNDAMLDAMARHVEDYISLYLSRLRDMWREIGLETFYFANDIWLDSWPSHLGKKNQILPLAFDIYPRYSELAVTLDQPFSCSYVPKLFEAFLEKGPLICAEMGCGWFDPACTVSPQATWQATMAAYAHGTRACFFYIAMDGRDADGDYVFNSLIDQAGRATPRLEAARALAGFCQNWGPYMAVTREVESSIAILHYPALSRAVLTALLDPLKALMKGTSQAIDEALTIVSVNAGLYGALTEGGYNPAVLNLEKATAEELASRRVILFNSIGIVDPDLQAKLTAYVEQGGILITLGTPLSNDTGLFPLPLQSVLNPQVGQVLVRTALDYVKFFWRLMWRVPHRFCAYTLKGMYPAMLLNRHAARAGAWIRSSVDKSRVWASRLISLTAMPHDGRSLLEQGKQCAAYRVTFGCGVSVFIGTLLGAGFDSPGYYLDDPERRASVAAFLGGLLQEEGIAPLFPPVADVEIVVREGPGLRLVIFINRGSIKTIRVPQVAAMLSWALKEQFSAYGSSCQTEASHMTCTLATDDVLCTRWEPDLGHVT